ncbi:solute carrier family 23 member 1-like isoform X2 [Paramormyrops kingsleyae]|uniref:solute carrier family 23 member 1-like isoform X2 n=1 Tax=Paramormyrops kingsleyae TaxID=1676925 RepID=UPI000CD5F1EA|nr:solute carrier family 23 member 2-like isoform X2 [Paramormyrops kingsleyae]
MPLKKDSNGQDNYGFAIEGEENIFDFPVEEGAKNGSQSAEKNRNKLAYCVTDVPPWYLCIILGIQHFLTAFGSIVAIPLILSQSLCLQHDGVTQSHLISTIFFVSGLCTLLQVTVGVRLPILQGGTFTFLAPSLALLSTPKWTCPAWTQNASLVNISSPVFMEEWQSRLREDSSLDHPVLPVPSTRQHSHSCLQQGQEVPHLADVPVSGYSCQWGVPTVSLAGVCGILAGVISSMVESVGDYHACAKLSGAPPPPRHAINRGVGIEGVGCLLAGAWGTGNGTTSYSENVGVLGITRVGSRTVILASGILMILVGLFGKIGAIFTTIPTPVVGGMLLVMFGVISAAGVSNLQYTDMNSSRNIFIFGFSMLTGLAIPNWALKNPAAIATGIVEVDQVVNVLLTTGMFVGGFFGFILDNTIPGSVVERGIVAWKSSHEEDSGVTLDSGEVYGLPFSLSFLASSPWVQRMPFCPPTSPVTPVAQSDIGTVDSKEAEKPDASHVIVGVAL